MKYINWLYFAQSTFNKEKILYFLYGLTAPTKTKDDLSIIYNLRLPGKKDKLICLEFTSTNHLYLNGKIDFSQLREIDKYKNIHEHLNDVEILESKETIQVSSEVYRNIAPSFTSLPINMKTYFSDSFNKYYEEIILNKAKKDFLITVIEILEKESKQPFKNTYSSMIGSYEIANINEWVEELSEPCYLKVDVNKDRDNRPYILKKHKDFLNSSFTIHLIIYNDYDEIIYDNISIIGNDKEELFLCEFNPKDDSKIEYWIFDEERRLIVRNKYSYIKGISLNIGVSSTTYNFPANTFSKNGQLSKSDHTVSTVRYSKSNIETREKSKHNRNFLTRLIKKQYRKDSEDAGYFFNKNDNAFNELKNFFNKITNTEEYNLYILDPFISSSSLDYFKLLTNAHIKIYFISCWDNSTSPDGKRNITIDQTIDETQKELDNLKDYHLPISYVKWFNLKPNKFHDRYLYLVNRKAEETKLFSISNSLNNLLVNYENLLILPLKESVKDVAENYIKSIISQCDDMQNRVYPRVEP